MSGDNHEFKDENARALIGTVDWDSGGEFPNRKAVRLDPVTHALLTVTYPHHEIHAGEHHIAVAGTLFAADEEFDILFKSPSIVPGFGATGHPLDSTIRRKAHMEITVDLGLAGTVYFYRNSTKTFNAAASVNYWNRNLHALAATEKYYTSAMSVCVSSGGTETSNDILGPAYIGSANNGGQGIIGGVTGGRNEFVLEPDEWYRIRVVSRAANNAVTGYLDWYDHAEQTDLTG